MRPLRESSIREVADARRIPGDSPWRRSAIVVATVVVSLLVISTSSSARSRPHLTLGAGHGRRRNTRCLHWRLCSLARRPSPGRAKPERAALDTLGVRDAAIATPRALLRPNGAYVRASSFTIARSPPVVRRLRITAGATRPATSITARIGAASVASATHGTTPASNGPQPESGSAAGPSSATPLDLTLPPVSVRVGSAVVVGATTQRRGSRRSRRSMPATASPSLLSATNSESRRPATAFNSPLRSP
jgi:hypothetical protein